MPSNHRRSRIRPRVALKKGDPVYDVSNPKDLGTIVVAGAEVSEVKFQKSAQRYITNKYLRLSVRDK